VSPSDQQFFKVERCTLGNESEHGVGHAAALNVVLKDFVRDADFSHDFAWSSG
jgi:hypothetical protein